MRCSGTVELLVNDVQLAADVLEPPWMAQDGRNLDS
jgi:hypothetical protein